MKWIVLCGSSNTGKTYTLSEVVAELTKRGGRLVPPSVMPVWNSKESKYDDATYELSYASKKIFVVTEGDYPSEIESGFTKAVSAKADVLISTSRSKPGCGHLALIESKITSKVEPFFVAAFKHADALRPRIRANRVEQIIKMI